MRGMDERRDIANVTGRVEKRLRQEIVYARGYLAMHRERYIAYLRDLRKARWDRDYRRAAEIIDDLHAFIAEAEHLQEKERSAYGRLTGLVAPRGFAAAAEAEALPPDPRFARPPDDARGADDDPGGAS